MTSFLNGANSLRSQVTASGSSVINGGINLSGNNISQFSVAASSTLTYNGNIAETSAGAFASGGTAFFRGTGTHIINGNLNLPTAGSSISVTDGALAIINSTGNTLAGAQSVFGTLRLGNNDALGTTASLVIGQSGDQAATLDLNGFNQTVGSISFAAPTGNLTTKGISNSHATATSTFTVNQAVDASFNGTLTGRINLVKGGASSLTLPATASTFTGNVTVNNGTLVASGAGASANGSLGAANVAGRTITVNSPGILSFTSNNIFGNGAGNANLPSMVINAGGTLISTRYNVLGNVTLNGGTLTQTATDSGNYQGFQLLGGVTTGGSAASFISTTNGKGTHLAANTLFTVADATSSTAVDLTVNTPLINQSGDFGNAAGGFTKAGPGTMALTATSVHTGATAVTAGTLQIGDGVASAGQLGNTAVTVSASAVFAYNRPGAVSQTGALNSAATGAGTFNVSGDATTAVTLNAGGSFSGIVNINNGSLIAGVTNPWSTALTAPTFNIAAGASLVAGGSSNHAHIGALNLSGGTVTTQAGAGNYDGENFQLNGDVTVTGSVASTLTREGTRTNADSGISLRGVRGFNVADVTGSSATDLMVSTELENTDAATITLAGLGGITKTGAGTMTLAADNSYGGVTTISNGTLQIGNAGATGTLGGGSVTNNAALVFNRSNPMAVGNDISGTGTVQQAGAGTTTITGQNTYSGVTTVSAGTLKLNRGTADNSAIPTDGNTGTGGDIIISGGNLEISASEQIGDNGSIILNSGSFGFGAATGLTETIWQLTNNGGSFSTGANALISLGPTVTWAGGTNTINTGGLVSDKHWVITGGTNTVQQDGLLRVQSGTGTVGMFFGGTASPTITVDSHATDPGEILLKQDVTVDSSLTSGTAQILSGGAGAAPGRIDMNGGTRTFDINNGSSDVDMRISTEIANGALTKAGAGTLELSGVSSYTGATTVNAGTLYVSGNIATSAMTVNTATLAGTGTTGDLSLSSTATVAPGNVASTTTGILSTGAVTTTAGATFQFEINGLTPGTQHDQISTTGALNLDGTLVLTLSFPTVAENDQFFIWLNDGTDSISGTFTGLAEGASIPYGMGNFYISYLANGDAGSVGNDISLTYVPEPSTALLAGAAGLLALGRRRRRAA